MAKQGRLWPNEIADVPNNDHKGSSDSDIGEVMDAYKLLADQCSIRIQSDRVSYVAPVNFRESLESQRHRWFPYKEGFSPSFVQGFVDEWVNDRNATLLDPFCGVGTTPIEASLLGGNGVGIEVSPLASFIARTKTTQLTSREIEDFDAEIDGFEQSQLDDRASDPSNTTVVSYFAPEYLDALLRVKGHCLSLPDRTQSLFFLAFLAVIETFSTHRKAGNGQKRKTRLRYMELPGTPLDQVRAAILRYLRTFAHDIVSTPIKGDVNIINRSSLEADSFLPHDTFQGLLTSPPYANCFDYSKIYMCELWLGDFFESRNDQKQFRADSVRSHVHARWDARFCEFGSEVVDDLIVPLLEKQSLWSAQIPSMLQGYFRDVGRLLRGVRHVMKDDAPLGIVVSNSVYGGIPVATDLLVAEVARKHGYRVECVQVFRHMIPSSQQFVRVKDKSLFRESMVVLRK